MQGHARKQVGHALKTLSYPKAISKAFYRKGEGRVWLVVNFLVSDPLFLRSGHSSVHLHQSKCYALY